MVTGWLSGARARPGKLIISPSGTRKIAERGYVLDDAQVVLDRSPLWKWQPASMQEDELGRLREVPPRWLLVGRGLGGRILCVIIDLPNVNGQSGVVTIFEASPRLQSEYDDWVRRAR